MLIAYLILMEMTNLFLPYKLPIRVKLTILLFTDKI
jgi:hypothetical protein